MKLKNILEWYKLVPTSIVFKCYEASGVELCCDLEEMEETSWKHMALKNW